MRIVTVAFDYPPERHRPSYLKLLDVFEWSVHQHIPDVDFCVHRIEAPDGTGVPKLAFLSNHYKLEHIWLPEMRRAFDDGVNVIFADCDMLCLGDPSGLFDREFDIAYTQRDMKLPLNGGIVFAKPTEDTLQFFEEWAHVDEAMYNDLMEHDGMQIHQRWRSKYGGMNQASFGCMLEDGLHDAKVIGVPTLIYNAVDTDWHKINSDTLFLHVKGGLRKKVMANEEPHGVFRPAMMWWYAARDAAGVKP